MTIKDFQDRLRQARGYRQKTQQELADAIGMSKSTIVKYELGHLSPTLSAINKMAEALQVSPYWLEKGRGAMEAGSENSVEGYKPDLMVEIIVAVQNFLEREELVIESKQKEAELYSLLYQKFAVKTDRLNSKQTAEVIDLARLMAQKAS